MEVKMDICNEVGMDVYMEVRRYFCMGVRLDAGIEVIMDLCKEVGRDKFLCV